MKVNKSQINPKADRSISQLLGWSCLSVLFSFYLLPVLLILVFHNKRRIVIQLIQIALAQLPFILFNSLALIFLLYLHIFNPQLVSYNTFQVIFQVGVFILNIPSYIILLILSWKAFSGESLDIFCLNKLAKKLYLFFKQKSYKKAVILNILCPGLGNIFLNKYYIGFILFIAFGLTLGVLIILGLAHYKIQIAQTILLFLGFYLRASDSVIQTSLSNTYVLGTFFSILLLIITLSFWVLKKDFSLNLRRVLGSFTSSYIISLSLLCILFLVPLVIAQSNNKEAINKRSQEILKELKKLQEKKNTPELPKKKTTLEEREFKFDLVVTENIDGINDFTTKPFQERNIQKEKTKITYKESTDELLVQVRRKFFEQDSRETKSYSEYITAKVREDTRDQVIWENTQNKPYAVIVQYIIETDGRISSIEIIESSEDLETDAIVVAVLESMSPLTSPPQKLKIIELFWNTGSIQSNNTELRNMLQHYPDGRIIMTE